MSVRTASRALVVAALTAPLSASLLLATAPAASAAATWTNPTSDGQVFASGGAVAVSAAIAACGTLENCATTKLTVTGPSFSSSASATARRGETTPVTVTVPATAPNGQYTATLSGGSSGSRTLFRNAAPAAPASFAASGSGSRDVSFTWARGSEPDLSGYALLDENGTALDDSIPLSACSGSSCSYGLYYPSDNPGTHSYALVARRPGGGCSGCAATLESGKSTASASLENPPPPPPTQEPTPQPTTPPSGGSTTGGSTTGGSTTGGSSTGGSTTGGSTTGGSTTGGSSTGGSTTGGSTTGGSATGGSTTGGGTTTTGGAGKPAARPNVPSLSDPIVASRRAFALRFNAFAPSLGIPKLPPLPALTLPTIPGAGPLPTGTFEPTLPYTAPTVTEKVPDGTLARPVAAVRDVLDSERLAKSIAGALVLLLAGAHVRRFLGSAPQD